NGIADCLARTGDVVEPPVTETDDDLPPGELRVEAHHLPAATAHQAPPAPIPKELRRCRIRGKADPRCRRSRRHDHPPQPACHAHPLTSFFYSTWVAAHPPRRPSTVVLSPNLPLSASGLPVERSPPRLASAAPGLARPPLPLGASAAPLPAAVARCDPLANS